MAEEKKVEETTVETKEEGATTTPQTLDDVLKDKAMQSEFDKRVAKALATSKAKWQEEYDAKVQAEKNEAERLAKMSETEKFEHELAKIKAEKEQAQAKLNAYELKNEAQKIATEKGIDITLLDLIDYAKETADSVKEKLNTIETVFNKAVEKTVNEKLKQSSPKQVAGNNATSEQQYLKEKYKDNPYFKMRK